MVTLKPTQHPAVTESSLPSPGTSSSESTDSSPFRASTKKLFRSTLHSTSQPLASREPSLIGASRVGGKLLFLSFAPGVSRT